MKIKSAWAIPVALPIAFFLLAYYGVMNDASIRADVLTRIGWTQAQWDASGVGLLLIISAALFFISLVLVIFFSVLTADR